MSRYTAAPENVDGARALLQVAGAYHRAQEIDQVIRDLTRRGFGVTHNWTRVDPHPPLSSRAVHQTACATLDIAGVRGADAVLVIMDDPDHDYTGTYCEIGAAVALDKNVIIQCPDPDGTKGARTCFFQHPAILHYTEFTDAMDYLDASYP